MEIKIISFITGVIMFALVQYTNGETSTVVSKRVKIIQGRRCIVKVGGTAYEAELLKMSDIKDELVAFQKESGKPKNVTSAYSGINDERDSISRLTSLQSVVHLGPKTSSAEHKAQPSQTPGNSVCGDLSSTCNGKLTDPGIIDKEDSISTITSLQNVVYQGTEGSSAAHKAQPSQTPGNGVCEDPQLTLNDKLPDPIVIDKNILSSTLNDSQNFTKDDLGISVNTGAEFSDTPESSAPSGYTELLNQLDDNWLKSSDESNIASQLLVLSSDKYLHDSNNLPPSPSSALVICEDVDSNIPATEMCSTENQQTTVNHHLCDLSPSSEKEVNTPTKPLSDEELSSIHNSSKDSDYHPEESTDKETDKEEESVNTSKSLVLSEKSLLPDDSPPDIRKLEVPVSKNFVKRTVKKHFCLFCKQLQCKLPRHLMVKHKDQKEVKELLGLSSEDPRRKAILNQLRKKGDYLHNTNSKFNTGILIASRQRQEKFKNTAEDYICCKKCKGFFSKKTVRFHIYKCDTTHEKRSHTIGVEGRRVAGYIHRKADPVLRRLVFPVLNDDEVSRSIRYDELVILYGNKLCQQYTLQHQYDMIRAQLRLLGRFKIAIKSINSEITDFSSIFHPRHFDSAVRALRTVANWDTDTMYFKTPAVAQNLSTLMKKMANKYRTECIKNQDDVNKRNVCDFLLLWEEDVPVKINKKALEDQTLQKRQKKVVLPSKNDIKCLFDYLKNQALIAFDILEKKFDLGAWKLLNSSTLILIQIFNRRRAGEIERLTLNDFKNKQELDENINQDLYSNLSKETIEYAKKYVRLTLRGKLSRTVSVLLPPYIVEFINVLCKFRSRAGVRLDNEFVFATPGASALKKKYIRACPLMRRFSNECGALIPSALRGTTLRKHIATFTAMLDVEENQLDRLANFMGHHKEIHKNIYRVPVPVAEMTDVSRLLVAAMGGDEEEEEEEENEKSESEKSDSSDEENEENAEGPNNDSNDASMNVNNSHDEPTQVSSINKSSTSRGKTQTNKRARRSDKNTPYSTKVRRLRTSPVEKTKRTKWSDLEKKAVNSFFGDIMKLTKLPSLSQCQEAISKHKVLQKRRPEQLKSYIDNQRKQKIRRKTYTAKKITK